MFLHNSNLTLTAVDARSVGLEGVLSSIKCLLEIVNLRCRFPMVENASLKTTVLVPRLILFDRVQADSR